jgi:hypothetical protein
VQSKLLQHAVRAASGKWQEWSMSDDDQKMREKVARSLHLYIHLIEDSWHAYVAGVSLVKHSLKSPTHEPALWRGLSACVQSASVVSRLLFPEGQVKAVDRALQKDVARIREIRCEMLRDRLGVTSPHVLQKREIRNHVEHFDERIDEWVASNEHEVFVDMTCPPGCINFPDGIEDNSRFREYDPSTTVFSFWGNSVNLNEVSLAMKAIWDRIKAGHAAG